MRTIPDNTLRKELSLRGRIVCALIGAVFVTLLFWKTRFFHGWPDAVGTCLATVIAAIVLFFLSKSIKQIPIILQKIPNDGDIDPGLQITDTAAAGEAPNARNIPA
jgi:hypothetical protein